MPTSKIIGCKHCCTTPDLICVDLVAGTAIVEGHDIRRDMDAVYALMGVCPQHDLLWAHLTAAEHLRFYGRIKGLKVSPHAVAVPAPDLPLLTACVTMYMFDALCKLMLLIVTQGTELEDAVTSGLSAINLLGVARQPVGKFSGGMRRRLSVAISFMGNPAVVYLDEPSSVRTCAAAALSCDLQVVGHKRPEHQRRL